MIKNITSRELVWRPVGDADCHWRPAGGRVGSVQQHFPRNNLGHNYWSQGLPGDDGKGGGE